MKAPSGNVKLLAFIVFVLLLAPSCIKRHNWWEDSHEPHQGTAAWHPYRQYTADIEAALSILASTDPAEVIYFRSRGFPVAFIPGMSGRKADTTGLGVIEIPQHFAAQPAQLAVLLSHEIVHEQRHDPFATPTEYPLWRRLLWHGEEEVAHNKDLWVAIKLWPRYHAVWNVLGWEWLIEPFFYLAVGPVFLFSIAGLLALAYDAVRHFKSPFAPRLPRQQNV